ncbi:ABC-type Fe3+ transport system, substrate-binding protein [Noviherbaspirillum humi]|uniref:ABC-type Fe3+ transport system, substrate-binding protein n=1 Tax=Noviherbaspirillum humi TaxID=1688639 RepID=A0A239I5I0_9BURK|nr:extracellular solute-binding protein [Noviherbaspirillum humi]SNS88622.1 ABC-type Fe3+ transport system, substrate-binding protein [Noviherbaspirillum humi]
MRPRLCAAVLACLFSAAVHAAPITIVTSFPKEITETYKKAFEKKYPDIKVEILNKNTVASLAYVKENAPGQRPDIFWASAPDAFEVMSREKLLEKAPEVKNPAAPAKIGNYPMNDPEDLYYGQALSGYGIMWNTRYLKANNLPAPAEWSDLTKPAYFGHVATSSPSRSGTTHLTVETILQGEGWDKGWTQLLQIAGNCAAVTERSFGVPDGVNSGQFGIGLVIDFFGLAGKYSGFPVEFVYPKVTSVVPASIGLIAGGKNPADAKKFMQFALSSEGQLLLLDPKISRLPIVPYDKLGGKVPAGYPNIFEVAQKSRVQFDSELAEKRYHVVTSMFDQTVTFRLKELQAATKAIHEAEKKLAAKPNPKAAELLKQARDTAYAPVVDEAQLKKPGFLDPFLKSVSKKTEGGSPLAAIEEQWNTRAKANYQKALELAQQAAAM